MAKRHLHRLGRSRRRQLRALQFDTLEDRRLMAGLNIMVFEDVNDNDIFDSNTDAQLSDRVFYLDSNRNGRMETDETFAVSDASGLLNFSNLGIGEHSLRSLSEPSVSTAVNVVGETDLLSIEIEGSHNTALTTPILKPPAIPLVGTEDNDLALDLDFLKSLVEGSDQESLYFFLAKETTFGQLQWSVYDGGVYKPNANFFGDDTFEVIAFNGQAWSDPIQVKLTINAVDDLPTGLRVNFVEAVPENQAGAVLGEYVVDDVDGGQHVFRFSDPNLIEATDGVIRLVGNRELNFESASQIFVSIAVVVGGTYGGGSSYLTAATSSGGTSNSSSLQASALIPVTDRNDPSVAIDFQGNPQVVEFRRGHQFGTLRVIDEDRNEKFTWQTSDDRFYVDDSNVLRLLSNVYLATRDQTQVPLQLTATSKDGGESISTELNIRVEQAPPPFQNQSFPLDVNNDGRVSLPDALAIVNALNARGSWISTVHVRRRVHLSLIPMVTAGCRLLIYW